MIIKADLSDVTLAKLTLLEDIFKGTNRATMISYAVDLALQIQSKVAMGGELRVHYPNGSYTKFTIEYKIKNK